MTKIDIEAMRKQVENAIVESSVEGHTDLNDLTNKLLDLFLVMLSEQEKEILQTYNDPLLAQFSKQVDRDSYKTNCMHVVDNLRKKIHSA